MLQQDKLEKRKRKTENYACDTPRKVQATREKCAGLHWNQPIANLLKGTFETDEFISKIPSAVVCDFMGYNCGGFEHFMFSRNSPARAPDLEWLSTTETYQKASAHWREAQMHKTISRQISLDTLRAYRQRQIPLQTSIFPSNHTMLDSANNVSLPLGSNVFVSQVLSDSVRVELIISDTDTYKDPFTLSLYDAWDIVAGPVVEDWKHLPPKPQAFQHALSRILQDEGTKTKLKIQHGVKPSVQLEYIGSMGCFWRGKAVVFEFKSI
jgi:hypothetical protein